MLSFQSMSKTFLYFAYGSNLLAKRLHINNPSAVRAGIGKLKDYRLDFHKYSRRWQGCSATIVPHKGYHVWGALWEISLDHLTSLDTQEGVKDGIYFRFEVDVELPSGGSKKCHVFQQVEVPKEHFKLSQLPESRLPSQIYLNTITNGAKESALPEEYQQLLQRVPHNGFNGDVELNLRLNVVD